MRIVALCFLLTFTFLIYLTVGYRLTGTLSYASLSTFLDHFEPFEFIVGFLYLLFELFTIYNLLFILTITIIMFLRLIGPLFNQCQTWLLTDTQTLYTITN